MCVYEAITEKKRFFFSVYISVFLADPKIYSININYSPSVEADLELSRLLAALAVPYPFVALKHFSTLDDSGHWSAIDLWDAVAGESTCKVVSLDCIDPVIIFKNKIYKQVFY